MRVSQDRYARDLRRIDLAQRLIRYEVRTRWICAWTGLTKNRVRNLYRSYNRSSGEVRRHRGPSPTRVIAFTRSAQLRTEASAIGGLARALGMQPAKNADQARRDRLGIEFAEQLCRIYELFRMIVPESHLSMDQFIRLAIELTEGRELRIGHCENCHGALLIDRLGGARRLCSTCKVDLPKRMITRPASVDATESLAPELAESENARQQSLF